jgi:glycosyltransferase involved in cell wall biosynthesis
MSGLDLLGVGATGASRLYRAGVLRLMASMLRHPSSCLLVENADDLACLKASGLDPEARFALLGGPGIDLQAFSALPVPANDPPIAAFIGSMGVRKGTDVLMRAFEQLAQRGVGLRLELYGGTDEADAGEDITTETVSTWCAQHGAQWLGWAEDVREVWRRSDICVLPVRDGGGLPRVALEAAACGRPLIISDVAGCRHFVRDGIEGLIVPPENADALAGALERLARDPEGRQRMGEAARLRLLHGFTETHVKQSLKAAYASMVSRTASDP